MSTLHVIDACGARCMPQVMQVCDLEESVERTLVLLAEVERRYACERSVIEGAMHPRPWKDWRLEQLAKRHADERQPLVELLSLLHRQLVSCQMYPGPNDRDTTAGGSRVRGSDHA